ncbi:hypothetical protein L6R52_13815 [Myxococcota bacterium]|nr:hypothetical protein [Myxococcota bacterium]
MRSASPAAIAWGMRSSATVVELDTSAALIHDVDVDARNRKCPAPGA